MNKREKEVLGSYLDDEKKTLNYLKQVYKKSAEDIRERIAYFSAREDMNDPHLSSIIYQRKYQEALLKQIETGLQDLNKNQYKTLQDFFEGCYVNGYVGAMYNFEGQGIPLTVPIDPKKMVRAVQTDSKLSRRYYQKRLFPENVERLKLSIKAEVSRGIASGSSWLEVAHKVASGMNSPFDRALNDAVRIVRTEGHRINQEGYLDAGDEAKKKGADILKQWDATLDSRTRPWHQEADGQIREWEDDFTVNGEKMKAPSVGGSASNVINCRCQLLQRARWALDEDELKTLEERANFYGLDKSKDFEDFKQKYLKLPENAETVPEIPMNVGSLREKLNECKTTDDVSKVSQEYFRNKEGCKIEKIDLKGISADVAKDLMIRLDDLDDRYVSTLVSLRTKSMRDDIGGQCTPTTSSVVNYLMSADPNDLQSEITLNSKFLKNRKVILADFLSNNRSNYGELAHCAWIDEENSVYSTITHEYGHSILAGKVNELLLRQGKSNPVFMSARRMYQMYKKELSELEREIINVRSQFAGQENGLRLGIEKAKPIQDRYDKKCISRYSKESVGEFIAEAFCDAELSSNPRSDSLKVHELLIKNYGKGKKK